VFDKDVKMGYLHLKGERRLLWDGKNVPSTMARSIS
jgi:hypothetical protein